MVSACASASGQRPLQHMFWNVEAVSDIWVVFLVAKKLHLALLSVSLSASLPGFNSLVGGVMGFSILLSAEVFKHNAAVWYLDGSIGVLIGLTIFAYGVK